jgi:hypothetical protein
MKKEDLKKNIGKMCIINHSPVVGLSGKKGLIKDLDYISDGFMYIVSIKLPLSNEVLTDSVFLVPCGLCSICESIKSHCPNG